MVRLACAMALAAATACGGDAPPAPPAPPSLVGTWCRANDRLTSILAFFRTGDTLAFRWLRKAADGRRRVDCDWDGSCAEVLDGRKVGEYRCSVLPGSTETRASVKCDGWLDEGQRLDMSWTDDFELVSAEELRCRTREANGLTYVGDARPLRTFTKVSRSVADPPRPGSR